ncbi:glycoside hydrolase superfamily [Xylariales sp. PMI_506]|nr:glycoside hydrolase superfamily [Xylariales sp. PMI_506]
MKASISLSVLSSLGGVLAVTNSSGAGSASNGAPNTVLNNVVPLNTSLLASGHEFVSGLTNEQKIKIINGQSVVGANSTFKALAAHDGDSGINQQFYVSGFSMVHSLVMTWNKDLYYQQFKALGDENYGMGYNLIEGPVISPLGRVPWGGRQNEGYSPEPYLAGIAMGKSMNGVHDAGVLASGRHFLYNEQETNRMSHGILPDNYSSDVDDKTAHEIYLWPFADGANQGMMAVMCGMNRANNSLSCENPDLLNKFLKTQIGFVGLVLPDVSSQNSSYLSANAGLDLAGSIGGGYWGEAVMLAGLKSGALSEARLDDMAVRNLIGYYFVGLDNGKQPSEAGTTDYRDVRGNHSALIRQVGQEALILLKNDKTNGGGLPLNKPRTMAVFGSHAAPNVAGPNLPFSVSGWLTGDYFPGHNVQGCGSGGLSLPYVISPQHALTERAAQDGSMIWWILNDTYVDPYQGGFPFKRSENQTRAPPGGGGPGGGGPGGPFGAGTSVSPSIVNYAEQAEVCLVFMNSASGEGGDRTQLYTTVLDDLVITVASKCNNTVVVVNTAGPRVIDAWVENENVTAVLYSGLLGQESGRAISDVLHGDVNPSGKLAHTIAKKEADYPAPICKTVQCEFTEGVYIDYRWFDKQDIEPRYPFGYGLSYTTFSISAPTAKITNSTAIKSRYPTQPMGLGGEADLWNEVVSVTATVENTGSVYGAEVAQLYVSFPAEAEQPIRILRGFEKVFLEPGQSSEVTFSLRRRDISYWDVAAQQWAIATGTYTFTTGSSSRDLFGNATLTL